MRSTLSTFTKQTMGRVRRRTSTKQRSIRLVVRSLRYRWQRKAKKESNSGKSRSSRRTMLPYSRRLSLRETINASRCFSGDALLHSHARWMLISPLSNACRISGGAVLVSCLTLVTFPTDTPAAAAISHRTLSLSYTTFCAI